MWISHVQYEQFKLLYCLWTFYTVINHVNFTCLSIAHHKHLFSCLAIAAIFHFFFPVWLFLLFSSISVLTAKECLRISLYRFFVPFRLDTSQKLSFCFSFLFKSTIASASFWCGRVFISGTYTPRVFNMHKATHSNLAEGLEPASRSWRSATWTWRDSVNFMYVSKISMHEQWWWWWQTVEQEVIIFCFPPSN